MTKQESISLLGDRVAIRGFLEQNKHATEKVTRYWMNLNLKDLDFHHLINLIEYCSIGAIEKKAWNLLSESKTIIPACLLSQIIAMTDVRKCALEAWVSLSTTKATRYAKSKKKAVRKDNLSVIIQRCKFDKISLAAWTMAKDRALLDCEMLESIVKQTNCLQVRKEAKELIKELNGASKSIQGITKNLEILANNAKYAVVGIETFTEAMVNPPQPNKAFNDKPTMSNDGLKRDIEIKSGINKKN